MNLHLFVFFMIILFIKIFPSKEAPTSGPYQTTMQYIQDCKKPSRPYMKDRPMYMELLLHNTSRGVRLSSNVTVLRQFSNLKTKIKSSIWHNNKWEINFVINNLACHGPLMQAFHDAFKIHYDSKTCTFFKGTFVYKNIDQNKLEHLWKKTSEYGRTLWRFETSLPAGIVVCKEYQTVVTPV